MAFRVATTAALFALLAGSAGAAGPSAGAGPAVTGVLQQGKKLTAMGEQTKGFSLARREVISWKAADGTTIEGVLSKPADFDAKKKYPLLVVIHGGPTGVDQPIVYADRYYPVERFVAKGALVLRPNYRGSAGYGGKFRALNVRNLGVGDYADVISGVDTLIAKGWVDKDRVGSMGWSQGGYISAFITASSDRFKAVSVGAGISDWLTYYANTDITPFTEQYLHATPWDDPEIYKKTSPISYIAKAKTPTLIQHGENDRRVPITNAYELRQALEDRGVPVKMVVYKGFGHGINKPKQQRAVMEENEKWFARYIWGEIPAPPPAPAATETKEKEPATSTLPSSKTVAEWLYRPTLRLPVKAHVPFAGSYNSAPVTRTVPLNPPATSTLPEGSSVAVCMPRLAARLPAALQVLLAGSYNSAELK
jgi:dienelactone hydrolase